MFRHTNKWKTRAEYKPGAMQRNEDDKKRGYHKCVLQESVGVRHSG